MHNLNHTLGLLSQQVGLVGFGWVDDRDLFLPGTVSSRLDRSVQLASEFKSLQECDDMNEIVKQQLQIETADNAHCNQQLRNRTQQLDSTQKELEQLQKQMLAVIDMPGCHKDLAAALKESQRRKEEIIKLQALVAQLRKSLSYKD